MNTCRQHGSNRGVRAAWGAALFLVATCTAGERQDHAALAPLRIEPALPLTPARMAEVPGIVERRCVACHGCYDAPCQLKLSSPDGLARGATKVDAYDTERLTDVPPTRLGIDAHSVPQWRALGFHAVVAEGNSPDLRESLMARLIALGRQAPVAANAPLPADVALDLDRTLTCPAPAEFDDYRAAMPHGGMPYGMAPVPDEEFETLWAWVLSGEALPARSAEIPPGIQRQVAEWEAFFNADEPRARLVNRYLYEHLFLARLHFEGDGPRRFFRLVRSSTPPGQPVREIATRRPFDDPGGPFHYRLVPLEETIVHKDHIVYQIGPDRMARLNALFYAPGWHAGELPPYGIERAGNPFEVFAAIPAESRYRFLLDDALYFVRSFIRGPVCHGQVATDVIEDRFWVAFLAPEWDLSITDPAFLRDGARYLKLPYASAEGGFLDRLWPALHDHERAWLRYRDERYAESSPHAAGMPIEAIWDGDGRNANALLTVFRNEDNATVVEGFVGDVPETAWVIDYPVFERIYYDLVAGYDVFGSVEHQLTTRLYMDHLRREGEFNFLSFLPVPSREELHREWYRGPLSELHAAWASRVRDDVRPTGVQFSTASPKRELLLRLIERGGGLWPLADPINRCEGPACAAPGTPASILAAMASEPGAWVRHLPDLAVLRVVRPDGSDEVFTLFHDKAYTNVALLMDEQGRREPEKDVMTVMRGQPGSYPNFFFEVAEGDLASFVAEIRGMRSPDDWLAVVARHGVRRADPAIWRVADALNAAQVREDPVGAGLLDLNRYIDPKPAEKPASE